MANARTTAADDSPPAPARPSVKETLTEGWKQLKQAWNNLPTIGQGHFVAWLRQGLKELTHMLLPAFPQGQHVVEEPGLWGNPTQGEVARNRQDQEPMKQQVAALNEEPPKVALSATSPADLVEKRLTGAVHGQEPHQSAQEMSPADLNPTTTSPQQQQQSQHQTQRQSLSM
jgi:hypothetical protein